MATVDLTVGGTSGAAANLSGRIFTHEIELDFDKTNRGAADVLQLFDIPAGSFVLMVGYQVVTAEGGAATFDLGDGATPAGYVSNADANAVGRGVSGPVSLTEGAPNTVTGYSAGKFYSAADTIDMIVDAALDAAKIRVWAVLLDFNW